MKAVGFGIVILGAWLCSKVVALVPWEPVELNFEATDDYAWWEFPVTVQFVLEGDAASTFQVKGFWDGEKRWVVRSLFPTVGTWHWEAKSEDGAIGGAVGEIQVSSARQEQLTNNPNLRGSLIISENGRYFKYADGTPFFMLGSTLWAANTARCGLGEAEGGPFHQHLADRKSKGYNTILMQYFHGYGDYPGSPGHRNEGGKPYLDIETKSLNPEHFKYLDVRMRALWNRGFVAAIPTTWWGKTNNCVFTLEDARRMSTYCAVRYGAFNSIWSLSGEYQYAFKDCGWTPEDFNTLGEAVQLHNTFKRPLSIHPSGRTDWDPPHNVLSSLPFHGESWLDHHWLQTGQGRDRLFNIVTRLKENRELTPAMPVFCSEAFYERAADSEGAYHSRWQVWTAFLNGAAGFGYGAFGLWQFYDPSDAEGETGKFTGREKPWNEAQAFEGGAQLIHARNLLTQFDWWKLVSAREQVRVDGVENPLPDPDDLSPPQAASIGKDTWIVYVPRGNENRTLALETGVKANWAVRWINPRDGSKGIPRLVISHKEVLKLGDLPNASEDWVCVARMTTGSRSD